MTQDQATARGSGSGAPGLVARLLPARAGVSAVGLEQVLGAAWPGRSSPGTTEQLDVALRLARANQVEGALARCHPDVLAEELRRVQDATAAFDRALTEATGVLREHGIDPVLIKYVPGGDHVYSNFDLVVGAQLPEAVRALAQWGSRASGHPLERTKIFVEPPEGPSAHLHQEASWWDVPTVDGATLRARASDTGQWLVPAPVDELRIWVAHALFQNLSVDLSELLALRPLLRADLIKEAAAACRLEGWDRSFRRVVRTVTEAVEALDAGASVPVPVRLPVLASVGLQEHVVHLVRSRRAAAAVREAGLRGPLLLAKARRVRLSRAGR
jgi:hypothetical protein